MITVMQFGEVDIDGSLVASHSSVAEDIVMVNNGCLCCTVRGDLVKMLLELVKKKRDKFDHIVIETTGRLVTLQPLEFYKLTGLAEVGLVLSMCSNLLSATILISISETKMVTILKTYIKLMFPLKE